jgi:hypothetical protein
MRLRFETCTPKWKTSRSVLPCLAKGKRNPASRIGQNVEGNDTAARLSHATSYPRLRFFARTSALRVRS